VSVRAETVYRVRVGELDRHGDPIGESEREPTQAKVWPRSSNEDATQTNMVIDRLGLDVLDRTFEVLPSDQFDVRGKRYGVEGEPFDAGRRGQLVYLTGAVRGG